MLWLKVCGAVKKPLVKKQEISKRETRESAITGPKLWLKMFHRSTERLLEFKLVRGNSTSVYPYEAAMAITGAGSPTMAWEHNWDTGAASHFMARISLKASAFVLLRRLRVALSKHCKSSSAPSKFSTNIERGAQLNSRCGRQHRSSSSYFLSLLYRRGKQFIVLVRSQ